jgi:hypothetical protein
MKQSLLVLGVALAIASSALAQDPVKVDPKHYKIVAENERVRVLKATVEAGDKDASRRVGRLALSRHQVPLHEHPRAGLSPFVFGGAPEAEQAKPERRRPFDMRLESLQRRPRWCGP